MQYFTDSGKEEVKVYTGLGLTKNQARIYHTLTQLGRSNAKQISEASKIAREEVYRICPKLIDLGLIKKIIALPSRFEAVPVEESLSLLIKRRTLEVNQLRKRAKRLAEKTKKLDKIAAGANFQMNNSSFIMIPRRAALIRRIKQSIEGAEKSVSVITSMKRHTHAIYVYKRELEKALSRGVEFRVIVGEIKKDIPEIAKKFARHRLTSIKYILIPPTAVIVLVDNSKGYVMTTPTAKLEESPALQIENLSIIGLLQEYFENIWSTATSERARK